MGKGEIARYEQFLLFPQCFQKTYVADTLESLLVREMVNPFPRTAFYPSPNWKHLQVTIWMWLKWCNSSLIGEKMLWEEEKMGLINSFCSFPTMLFKDFFPGLLEVGIVEWRLTVYEKIAILLRSVPFTNTICSITCIQWPLKGSNESGLLQQVVFKCRFQ